MSDNRNFKEVVHTIKHAEKDTDKVLRAARLKRVENGRMSDERFKDIIMLILLAMILLFMLCCFYMMTGGAR